jgi:site-specific DNA-methyltransferase (adenine-specific)
MFPEELPMRLIKMFSFSGETILDPFLGSGTTSLAARNLGRNSVGYEINMDFIPTIKSKLNVSQSDLAAAEYVFQEDRVEADLNKEIEKLPYIFKDPHKLDKKIDPKKLQFGSKIDKDSGNREIYYSVKEVISPELVKLDNDLIVRLIGVKEKESANGQAIRFLIEKTKGQKVFMKFDNQKYDEGNNLLCYLYLRNKTFLNAHIIKEGLANVDGLSDFKYKKKFMDMQRL